MSKKFHDEGVDSFQDDLSEDKDRSRSNSESRSSSSSSSRSSSCSRSSGDERDPGDDENVIAVNEADFVADADKTSLDAPSVPSHISTGKNGIYYAYTRSYYKLTVRLSSSSRIDR